MKYTVINEEPIAKISDVTRLYLLCKIYIVMHPYINKTIASTKAKICLFNFNNYIKVNYNWHDKSKVEQIC